MITDDHKIVLAARNFLKRFGPDAPAEAIRRAEELRDAGNLESYATWMAIHEVVNVLARDGRENG